MSGQLFISYRREDPDSSYVSRLADFLTRAGLTVWFDRDITAGEGWHSVIEERIDTCHAVIVVMTPGAHQSKWVNREITHAETRGRRILPLLLAGRPFFRLADMQHEDVTGGCMPSARFVEQLRQVASAPATLAGSATEGIGSVSHLRRVRVGALPVAADCFQDRSIAEALDAALANRGTAVVTQILSGMGGVGKTQLAASLARREWDAHAVDVLVWITASSPDAIQSGYARAGEQVCGLDTTDPKLAAGRFLEWLADTDRRWLLVLDDLFEPGHLDQWWPPTSPTGWTVITTRRHDAALASHGRVVDVGLFSPGEAHAYLRAKFADHPDRLTEADQLAADLGYLPLALAHAATFIADRGITCAEYRQRFADRRRSLAELTPEPDALPDSYRDTVAVTWALSIERADRLQPAGLARTTLTLLSLLDPNAIPISLLTGPPVLEYLSQHRTSIDHRRAQVDESAARDAVACLARLNLATTAGDMADQPVARVHALVQRATREQAAPELINAAATSAADAIHDMWPDVERDPHLSQLLRANTTALRGHAEDQLWQPDAHQVLFRAGRSLGDTGRVAEAARHFHDLAAQATIRLGPDHVDTLFARHDLAWWRGRSGDRTGAAAAFDALLADRQRVLGPDHRDTLTGRHELAAWRADAGDLTGAVAAFEALLADRQRVLGPDDPDALTTRENLARWRGKAGDPAGAVAAFEALLDDRMRVLGPDHPHTLNTRRQLARWQGDAGDPAKAVAVAEALLVDTLRVLGPDHPETLGTRGDLAIFHAQARDSAKAVATGEALLADLLRVLGADHLAALVARMNLADSRGEAGDPAGAVAAFEALLTDQLRVLGPNQPHTLRCRHGLVRWQGKAGDPAGAVAEFQNLLTDFLRAFGPDHPYTLELRHDLAQSQGDGGDPAEAVAALQALLADRLRVLGPDHPDTLTTRNELAQWHGKAGNPAVAVTALETLLADRLRVLAPNHPDTLTTRHQLDHWTQQANRWH